ncbi:IS701 family transposase [Chondromyces crocatus]|uniref:Transposase n=1 Tax=Chondromyces crocatus TaxID=52 RepID=A0A0K1EAF7_CHOCO|nr:IS701 family transposase [Chondromyces crocatus]AKT37839.1 transposase [Chondromyces crocatus]
MITHPSKASNDTRGCPDATLLHVQTALTTVWDGAWSQLLERVGVHFSRSDVRTHTGAYLKGLLSPVDRKNGWQLAEVVGDQIPYALQHLLGRARWDADAVRDDLRGYVVDHLGDPSGMLVIDETGFLKKGTHSAGVQRQYSGMAGRIENSQVGVFLAYATPHGHTFINRALYLPASWLDDRGRCERAGIPADATFATKPQLALQMLKRALDAGVTAAWVVGDEVYGQDSKVRRWLEERRQPYVLAVSSQHRIWRDFRRLKLSELVDQIPAKEWHRLSAGNGSKEPRWYDWAYACCEGPEPKSWQCGILFRRSVTDPSDVTYYVVGAIAPILLRALACAAGSRWTIEESFESAKGDVGLDHYEVRSWTGWYRHVTLALWAHALPDGPASRCRRRSAEKKKVRFTRSRRSAAPVDGPRGPTSALVAPLERAS